jgi:hypothetical protein
VASIILKIDDKVPHKDLDKLRLAIVKSLKQQGVPVYMSYTDFMCHNDIDAGQVDMTTPVDVTGGVNMNTPGISA